MEVIVKPPGISRIQAIIFLLVLLSPLSAVDGFLTLHSTVQSSLLSMAADKGNKPDRREQADELLAEAQRLRSEISAESTPRKLANQAKETPTSLPWTLNSSEEGDTYRLYVDIGREEGTWMDRRWGASGRRISFTVDVQFSQRLPAEAEEALMVKDNFGGKSSESKSLLVADFARLRDGFERMACQSGVFRIDSANGRDTVRFFLRVQGTTNSMDYGDVSVPEGALYFSLPSFGKHTGRLSTKEGPVTVRQVGWNTGWRREESRIVGTFYARPIEEARRSDGF